ASHDTDPGVVGGDNYSTYHIDIPKDVALTGTTGHEFWVVAESSGYNYINIPGVSAPPASSPLASFWRFPLFVASEPYNAPPVCDLVCLNSMPNLGKGHIEFDASGSTDPDGDTLTYSWDFNDDGTFGDTYDSGTDDKPMKDWDANYVGDVCVKVSDGIEESICCVAVDITALHEINVTGSPNISINFANAKDIGIDTASDQVAISNTSDSSWLKYTSTYGTVNTYYTGWAYMNWWDWSSTHSLWGAQYGGAGLNSLFSWSNWSGGNYGAYWFGVYCYGFKDVCNLLNTNDCWGIWDFAPSSSYGVFMQATGYGGQSFPYYVYPPWYNGSGTAGVILANIKGIDMVPYSGSYQMYFLETTSATTAVVELYTLASTPSFVRKFGDSGPIQLYQPLDITVDSSGNVYVLDIRSSGKPAIFAWDSSGNLWGTSDEISTTDCANTPLRIDAFVSSTPDQIHLLQNNSVTRFEIQ
ncbi:MAG: PKD domain-containing protein, partial [bacterium]|nr:PKD domain-containing protein [bacterium]